MRLKIIVTFSILILFSGCSHTKTKPSDQTSPAPTTPLNINTAFMKLSSSTFQHNQIIPLKYSCGGSDISPPLTIKDVPESARSLVLIVDDPDAPRGAWLHWTVWNIDPKTREIAEDSIPSGAQEGMTDFGRTGYGGPCPPSGTHRYFFKLYALDIKLNLAQGASLGALQKAMENDIITQAELIGLYSKK